MMEIGALMDPDVDEDFWKYNPDMVDDDGHRVHFPRMKVRSRSHLDEEMDHKHNEDQAEAEETQQPPAKRARNLSDQALRNIPDVPVPTEEVEVNEFRVDSQPFQKGGR
jgi:hypothetical protein